MCAVSNTAFFLYLYSTDFMLSWYVAKVFPKWSWDGSSCPYYYWYHFCFYIIIIIKIADNITAIPLLELCSTECSEVTIKGLNDKWATYVQENLLLMDVTSIWGGVLMCFFPRIWPSTYRGTVCIRTLFMLLVKMLLREKKVKFFLWQIEHHTEIHVAQQR